MGILDKFLPKKENPPSPSKEKPSSPFEKSYFITRERFNRWVQKSPEAWREAFGGSISKREKILEKLREYWPESDGSLTPIKLHTLKQKLERDRLFGETPEKQKEAREVLKLIETFEKYYK